MIVKLDDDTEIKLKAQIIGWGLAGIFILGETLMALFIDGKDFTTFNIVTLVVISLLFCVDRVRTGIYFLIMMGEDPVEEEGEE